MVENTTMQGVKRFTLAAQIIRADGSVEDLGIVSGYDADPTEMAKLEALGAGRIRLYDEEETD